AGYHESREHRADLVHCRLGRDMQSPSVEHGGGETCQGSYQEHLAGLQFGGGLAGEPVVVGELGQADPVLRGALHPGADVRHRRAREPEAVVENTERAERAAHTGGSPTGIRGRPFPRTMIRVPYEIRGGHMTTTRVAQIEVRDPGRFDEVVGEVAVASPDEIDRIVREADAAAAAWARAGVDARAEALLSAARDFDA